MTYFGKSNTQSPLQKIEPRTTFLILWITLCAVVLGLIVKGGSTTTPTEPVAAPAVAAAPVENKVAAVLVPQAPIAAGQKLVPELFITEQRQIDGIQGEVYTKFSEIEGAYAAVAIREKAPLQKSSVTFTAPINAVAARIPEGFRAVTIPVNTESAVEGWVRPGARVDIIWISTIRNKQVVSTIVEDAEILSAERSTDTAQTANVMPTHVTLLTTTNDAQKVQLAKTSGTLTLNLRGLNDRTQHGENTITLDSLLSKDQESSDLDTIGWVQMGSKSYDVTTGGKFRPSESAKKSQPLFKNDGVQ